MIMQTAIFVVYAVLCNIVHDFCSCGDGKCVPISVLCDHFIDCIDQSDENCCKYTQLRHVISNNVAFWLHVPHYWKSHVKTHL